MSGTKCGQCGHDNDATRVFCQNCGTRLERGEAGPSAPTTTPVPVKRTFKSKPGLSPLGALGQLVKGVVSLAFLGAVIALFIQLGRSPDGIPAAVPPNDAQATDLFSSVKDFTTSPFRRSLDLSQEQINNYLASRLSMSATADAPQTGRAFVVCGQDRFQFFVERKHLGLPFYFQVECEPLAGPEGATALVKSGSIGRVPLHPRLVSLMQGRVIAPVVEALAEPLDVLRKANQVSVQPGMVRLAWPGKTPGR